MINFSENFFASCKNGVQSAIIYRANKGRRCDKCLQNLLKSDIERDGAMDKNAFLKYILHGAVIHTPEDNAVLLRHNVYRHTGEKPAFIFWDADVMHNRLFVTSTTRGGVISTHFAICPGTETDVNQSDAIELLYVLEGSFSQNIAGKDCVFSAGSVVCINRNVLHYDYFRENTAILFLSIPNTLMENLFRSSKYSPYQTFLSNLMFEGGGEYSHLHGLPKPTASTDIEAEIVMPLAQIAHELASPRPGSTYITVGCMIRLFYNLMMDYQFHLSGFAQSDMRKLLFQEIERDIRHNCRDISIQFLQNKYHFNRDYFNRLIQESCGLTFRELRQQLRLGEAQRLLLETDLNIDQIALAVGYENQGYFYKQFHSRYGKTPREYRLSKQV